ncbi:MAG TPA: SDR family oxidoreductase [Streptosporangiaceae bacterium]|nr:SDR family oxidoreductase [Streptosporangiaceae bacterium]
MAVFPPHPECRPALIAGASSGIGAATAVALAKAGCPVALGARRLSHCQDLSAKITADGGQAVALNLDVCNDSSVATFVSAASEALGEPEVLVCSAGDIEISDAHDFAPADFAAQVNVHLNGVQRLVAHVVPGMIDRQRGDVVIVSSDVVRVPRPRMSAYVTAKHGVEGLARAMQQELEGTGVRVGLVRPGPTLTGMGSTWDHAELSSLLDEWSRWGLTRHWHLLDPSNVAGAVLAMISAPRGSHLTLIEVEPEGPVSS